MKKKPSRKGFDTVAVFYTDPKKKLHVGLGYFGCIDVKNKSGELLRVEVSRPLKRK